MRFLSAMLLISLLGFSAEAKKKEYKKMDKKELKEKLTPLQYKVTQKDGTEPAFKNEFWELILC